MTGVSPQLLGVGDVDPTRIGSGWQGWLAERTPQPVSVAEFADGELQVRLPRVGDRVDVFCDFRASTTHRVDMHRVLDVCAVARAARQQGATDLRLVTPEVPCMRQDRPITRPDSVELAARELVLDLLAAGGFQTVLSSYMKFDVTSPSLRLCFPSEQDLASWLVASGHFRHEAVIALDEGGAGLAAAVAEVAQVPLVVLAKRRDDERVSHAALSEESCSLLAAVGSALIVDDLLVSGQSLASAASKVARSGAAVDLDAFVWHCRPSKSDLPAISGLQDSGMIGSLLTSNLAPGAPGVTAVPADSVLANVLDAG